MTDVPDGLTLSRNRDLHGRGHKPWIRRAMLALLVAVILAGLFNVFGQRPDRVSTATDRAELELYAPDVVRGGLMYEARFTVYALAELKDARLVLDRGWSEGMTANTIEPSPIGEASDNGRLSLDLGHIPAGDKYVLYMQLQVNPTNVGRYDQDVALFDGEQHVLTHRHRIRVMP